MDRIDGECNALWTLKRGGQQLFSVPRVAAFRSFVLHHIIHHRGQLSVYLRLNACRSRQSTDRRPTKAREYTIQLSMSVRLAASSLAIAVAFAAAVPLSSAQSSMPPGAAGKKNPLLKLAEPWPDAEALKARRLEAEARPLFKRTDPLEFTLTANFGAINKDRNPESTTRYPATLTVAAADGAPRDIAVKLSARGHFRRMARNCGVVPLRVEFPKDGMAGTPFEGQTTLKLGTGCEDSKEYEQITLREYLQYPLFNLVTPLVVPRAAGARDLHRREVEEEERAALRAVHRARERRRPPQRRPRRRAPARRLQGPRGSRRSRGRCCSST